MSDTNHELRMFGTVSGRQVTIRPVAQRLTQKLGEAIAARHRQSGAPIDPPTYTVTTASGATETYTHDEKSVQTDEEKAAWVAHTQALARLQAEIIEAQTRLWLTRGLVLDPIPGDWVEGVTSLGIDLPDNADDLLWEYIQIEILPTPEDIMRALMAVTRLSMAGAPAESIDEIERSFRRTLERNAATPDQPDSG